MDLTLSYDPRSLSSRRDLASVIILALTRKGFQKMEAPSKGWEIVMYRDVDNAPGCSVRVYTTVETLVDGTLHARSVGTDAIRVTGIFCDYDGSEKPIGKSRSVHRVGKVISIVSRLFSRVNKMSDRMDTGEVCSDCEGPRVVSATGRHYCAARCWLEDEGDDNNNPIHAWHGGVRHPERFAGDLSRRD